MATITLTTSNNSYMRLDMEYTPGMGGFTITKLTSYRTDTNTTQGGSGSGVLYVNGSTMSTGNSFVFRANYSGTTMWSGSWWIGGTSATFTFSGTTVTNIKNASFYAGLTTYSCIIGIKQMDCYGAYTLSRTWVNTWGIAGASYSYSGYDNNTIYNKISISGTLNSNINTNVNASRKKTNFSITPYLLNKDGDMVAADNWSMDFSDDNGTTYNEITSSPYTTQYVERPYKFKNIKIKNGGDIYIVKNNDIELTAVDDIYSTTQGTSETKLLICLNLADNGKIQIKTNNGWQEGQAYYKTKNGWEKANKVYVKTANGWKEGQAK